MANLRRFVDPGAIAARRDVRIIGGGLIVVASAALLLRVFGVGFNQMAAWLPAVVDRDKGVAARSPPTEADMPADGNLVPPPEGDADAPTTSDNSEPASAGPPPAGDVTPPPEP